MRSRLGFISRLTLVTLFLAATAVAASDIENPFGLRFEPYEFEPAGGDKVDSEFGRFTVPENRSRPDGKQLELAFLRFPCTGGETCGSPIVYLAGGPGGSGIGTARFDRFPMFMAMREFGDVIAFDQRGTGESEADLDCGNPFFLPLDRPTDRAQAGQIIAGAAKACADKLIAAGHDVGAYNTLESADDLDALRQALGAEKLSLWGISYGSHLGLAMLKRHGDTIDRVILAGIEPLHHSWKLPSDQQTLLEKIAELVSADAGISGKVPDLLGSIERLLTRLDREPVQLTLTHPMNGTEHTVAIGKFDLQNVLTGFLRGPEQFAGLPDFIYRLERGDWIALGLQAGQQRLGEMWSMMSAAMDCASGMSTDWAERIAEEAKTTLLADAINFPYPEVCDGVPAPDLGDEFRRPGKSAVPSLLISGSVDGRTPPSNAERILPHFSNAQHLIVNGSGHNVFLSSPKVLAVMQAFMRTGELPFTTIDLPPVEFLAPRTIAEVSGEVLERYAGNYQIADDEFRRVIKAGNQLYTRRGNGQVLPIRPLSDSSFFYENSTTWLEFVVDENSVVERMEMHHDGSEEAEPAVKVE